MTTENNKIIAEFMGAKEIITETTHRIYKEFEMYGIIESIEDREDVKHFYQPEEMLFNSDWNWLMEVVEKIEQTTIKETYGQFNEKESNAIVSVAIENKFCQILSNGIYLNEIVSENEETKIEAVYNACVEFIKYYNEQTR